jgi:hypothetical protein
VFVVSKRDITILDSIYLIYAGHFESLSSLLSYPTDLFVIFTPDGGQILYSFPESHFSTSTRDRPGPIKNLSFI